ncbi:MAG: hypothetical protein H0U76_14195 [Ktedonobacteraceae bacterium]|nr:hypothetical protein [Ktedonobacteraceae bacterium]
MRTTRTEIITELRHRLGQSEQTEHLIDWVFDTWETNDFLLKCFGRAYTFTIIEAVESCSSALQLDDFVLCEPSHEEVYRSLLN